MPDPIAQVPDDFAAATARATAATAKLQQQLQGPAFQQQARHLMQARIEYEKTFATLQRINQQEALRARQMDVQRRYGRALGGAMNAAGAIASNPLAQQAWGAAQYGAGYVRSMAQRGLQGSVQAGRMDLELELLSREFAGVMMPFSDAITNATKSLRKWMESLDRNQQDNLMNATLAVGGTALAYRYRNTAVAAGSGAASLAGLRGAPVNGLTASSYAGGGIGAYAAAGGRFLGRLASRAPLIGSVIGTTLAATGLGTYAADKRNPYVKTFAEQNPEMAAELDKTSPDVMKQRWEARKGTGPSVATHAVANFGQSLRNQGAWLLNQVPLGGRIKYSDEASSYDQLKRELERRGAMGPGDGRRLPTLQGGGIEETGSTYFRILERYGKAIADQENGVEGEPDAAAKTVALLEQIAKNTSKTPETE